MDETRGCPRTEIWVTEIDTPLPMVTELFEKHFASPPPLRGRHFVCLAHQHACSRLLSYVHFQPFGDICLGGGACTNKKALREIDSAARLLVKQRGGAYRMVLGYALSKLSGQFLACFGYTADPLATRIDLQAGFRPTTVEHLLIHSGDLDPTLERALIAKAAAVGPF